MTPRARWRLYRWSHHVIIVLILVTVWRLNESPASIGWAVTMVVLAVMLVLVGAWRMYMERDQ